MRFNFYNPTRLIFGANTIKNIGKAIADNGCKKILLVAGGGSIKDNGAYEAVTSSLGQAGIEWVEFWGVRANPELARVKEAVEIARRDGVEGVLAVGGGSVIDTAKVVAAGVYMDDIWQSFEGNARITRALPLFTVLTLSATASEMNSTAVITNEQEQKKWVTASPHFFPRVSVVDPGMQTSLPWNQTVNGALDALAHIMEFYFVGTVEETTIALNESLMNSIIAMVDRLQAEPADLAARANLAWAATLAFNGVSGAGLKAGDWACHTIEHSVSCFYPEVAHGAGLGIIFPAWMLYVNAENPGQFQRFARNVWGCDTIEGAVDKMRSKIKQWDGFTSLRELGIPEEKLPALAENALVKGSIGGLRKLSGEDVENILRLAY